MTPYTKVIVWLVVQVVAMLAMVLVAPLVAMLEIEKSRCVDIGIVVLYVVSLYTTIHALVARHLLIAKYRKNISKEEEG